MSAIKDRARMSAGEYSARQAAISSAFSRPIPQRDLRDLPPGSGTSVSARPGRMRRIWLWLTAMAIVWSVPGCHRDWTWRGLPAGSTCEDQNGSLICVDPDHTKLYRCVRDWDKTVVDCAPWSGR